MVVVFERREALYEAQGLSILKFVTNLEPAYWLKEARSTELTLDQLKQVGQIVPLKIPQGSGPCKASNFTFASHNTRSSSLSRQEAPCLFRDFGDEAKDL